MNDIQVNIEEPSFVFQVPDYYKATLGSYPTFDDKPMTAPVVSQITNPQTTVMSKEDILLMRAARKAARDDSR